MLTSSKSSMQSGHRTVASVDICLLRFALLLLFNGNDKLFKELIWLKLCISLGILKLFRALLLVNRSKSLRKKSAIAAVLISAVASGIGEKGIMGVEWWETCGVSTIWFVDKGTVFTELRTDWKL